MRSRTNAGSRGRLGRTAPDTEPIRHMHDVLSNWSRRAILYCLQERDGPVAVTAVARQLLAWERDAATAPGGDSALVERTRSRLLQMHVVPLARFGVLEYDPDADTVHVPAGVTISVAPPWKPRSRHEPTDPSAPSNGPPTDDDGVPR